MGALGIMGATAFRKQSKQKSDLPGTHFYHFLASIVSLITISLISRLCFRRRMVTLF